MRLEILLFLVCIVFTLVSVVFVMSLLYIYRQICQPLCTLIIEFCQSFLERYFCFFLRFAVDGGFIFWYNTRGVPQKGSGGSDIIRTC